MSEEEREHVQVSVEHVRVIEKLMSRIGELEKKLAEWQVIAEDAVTRLHSLGSREVTYVAESASVSDESYADSS